MWYTITTTTVTVIVVVAEEARLGSPPLWVALEKV